MGGDDGSLSSNTDLIRFIEGRSDNLCAWEGANIVFASPGIPDINVLIKKSTCHIYYMPPWSFDELMTAAKLNELKISEDVLQKRVDMVGCIPRFVLCEEASYKKYEELVIGSARNNTLHMQK